MSAASASRTSWGCVAGLTFGYICRTLPSGPIQQLTRFAVLASAESHAPYARPSSRFSSERRGKGKPYFAANFAFASTESKEAPRISVFLFWKSA